MAPITLDPSDDDLDNRRKLRRLRLDWTDIRLYRLQSILRGLEGSSQMPGPRTDLEGAGDEDSAAIVE